MIESYTNTSLATSRRCMREFELRYALQLERDSEDREVLQVGQSWHKAHDALQRGENPYLAIERTAPGELWREKLARLFAAYGWFWKDQPIELIQSEQTFHVEIEGVNFSGQIDGIVRAADGRVGILERKSTSDSLEDESDYYKRLRLDVQVGLYGLAFSKLKLDRRRDLPDFILYDVVRKPTINPKSISDKEAKRMRAEIEKEGTALYYERFGPEQIEAALSAGRETASMYGARLTTDIGERPNYYFARREVSRTRNDYEELMRDIVAQIHSINSIGRAGHLPRNPDACSAFGVCDFFGLCSNNIHPKAGDSAPSGFRRREALHPELS